MNALASLRQRATAGQHIGTRTRAVALPKFARIPMCAGAGEKYNIVVTWRQSFPRMRNHVGRGAGHLTREGLDLLPRCYPSDRPVALQQGSDNTRSYACCWFSVPPPYSRANSTALNLSISLPDTMGGSNEVVSATTVDKRLRQPRSGTQGDTDPASDQSNSWNEQVCRGVFLC